MKHLTISAAILSIATTAAYAQSFDGVYNGSWDGSVTEMSCNMDFQGMDGGPFVITSKEYLGVEGSCDLSNPTNLRGIDGLLYDTTCFFEGDESKSRMLLVRDPNGVHMHHYGRMRLLKSCQ